MDFLCGIKREINADVTVIGGGTAGIFAAIAAAKTGADTCLIEKNGMLGGTMTVAGVNFPGLFFAWGKQIIGGPCWEAIKRTELLGGAEMPTISAYPKRHWEEQIHVNRFVYAYVINEMCREYGVTVLQHAMFATAKEEKDEIQLVVTCKEGLLLIHSKTVIDTTGDADVIRSLGYTCVKSSTQQPATLQNYLGGYHASDIDAAEIATKFNALHPDELPPDITVPTLMHYIMKHSIDNHVPSVDADTSVGKTEVEYKSARQLFQIYRFFKEIKGLENISINYIAEETGVRESNRIVGEKTITAEEYIRGVRYADAVCYAFYPIDLHVMSGIKQTFLKPGIVPTIPYGALIPKGSQRILCAGRCISFDQYANSAVRVQAPCMASGQAAGCAAALCAVQSVTLNKLALPKLLDALAHIGAILPR